jgi:hypothetical protein
VKFDPFDEDESSFDIAGARLVVSLLPKVALAGYPSAKAILDQMALAWDAEVTQATPPKGALFVRLPEGWGTAWGKDGSQTCVVDRRQIVRAISGQLDEKNSGLLIQQRYEIKLQTGVNFSDLAYEEDSKIFWFMVVDHETGLELQHSSRFTELEESKAEKQKLLEWLDSTFPQHRDPFAYWSDCEVNLSAAK